MVALTLIYNYDEWMAPSIWVFTDAGRHCLILKIVPHYSTHHLRMPRLLRNANITVQYKTYFFFAKTMTILCNTVHSQTLSMAEKRETQYKITQLQTSDRSAVLPGAVQPFWNLCIELFACCIPSKWGTPKRSIRKVLRLNTDEIWSENRL